MRRVALTALAFVFLLSPVASAEAGRSYFSVRGEVAASHFGSPWSTLGGVSVDWGVFQNRFVTTGTRLGISRSDPDLGASLMFGGGPQFHLPIGGKVLIIPAMNFGYRIGAGGAGLAGYTSVAAAYRHNSLFAGLEAELPIFYQGGMSGGFELFPRPVYLANLVFGFYYK